MKRRLLSGLRYRRGLDPGPPTQPAQPYDHAAEAREWRELAAEREARGDVRGARQARETAAWHERQGVSS